MRWVTLRTPQQSSRSEIGHTQAAKRLGAASQHTGDDRGSTLRPAMAPALQKLGQIDWRFAMPFADLTAGINFETIQNSSLARALVMQLAVCQGLAETDVQKLFGALGDID